MYSSVAFDYNQNTPAAGNDRAETETYTTTKWGALVLDVSDKIPTIIYCCDTICDYTGFSKEELLEQAFDILSGPSTSKESVEMLEFMFSNILAGTVNFTHYRKDGSAFDHRLKLTPLKDSDHELTAWLVEANYVEKVSWIN